MKFLLLLLVLVSSSVFAQRHAPYPYPGGYPGRYNPWPGPTPWPNPRPEDFCTRAQREATTVQVLKECDTKMAEFSAEHGLTCKITTVNLYGCRATCKENEVLSAKLRMDVEFNCRREEASLRKTVITWY